MNWRYIVNRLLEEMTQQQLAEKAGCSQPFISFLASGKQGGRGRVNFETAQKLISLCVLHGIPTQEIQKTPEAS